MAVETPESLFRRIEKVEERLNLAERDLSTLNAELHNFRDELSHRVNDVKSDLKSDIVHTRTDIRERVESLKGDIKEDINDIGITLGVLSDNLSTVSESLQNLYITHNDAKNKIGANEKIIWSIAGFIGSVLVYFIVEYMKTLH